MTGNLLLLNGHIMTMNPAAPLASAMAVQNGKIVAIGSDQDVRAVADPKSETINLEGRTASPGLNDAHAHPMHLGFSLADLDIASPPMTSVPDIVALIRNAADQKPPGVWIVGRGYDQARLDELRHPNRHDLDTVSPDHPVLLYRACYHIGVANSAALARAGISATTPDPDGGAFDRDEHGQPTGVLRETALEMVRSAIAEPTQTEIEAALLLGGEAFLAAGVTSAVEAVINTPEALRAYQSLWRQGRLPIRSYLMMIIDDTLDELASLGITTGFGDSHLRIGPAKLFADGSIGGHTARMRQPYEGTDAYGLWMLPPEEIKARVLKAHRAGFQIGIHAIGDAAIDLILDAYDEAQIDTPRPNARHRIEHCSIIDEGILQRLARSGVIPIPGTSFLYYFRDAYVQNLGMDRLKLTYGMKSFLDHGIIAAASTDAPVVSPRATIGIQTMMTRLDQFGQPVWTEQAIGLEEAVRAYTWNGAYASFEEQIKGSLEPGKLGDVTVFETDLRTLPPGEIGQVEIDYTIMNGTVVFARS